MEALELSAEQVGALAAWSETGGEFSPVSFYGQRPSFARDWDDGDVLVTQGDAYVQIGVLGSVKDAVPPIAPELS